MYLKYKREQTKEPQRQLGNRVGGGAQYLNKVENLKKTISFKRCEAIALALNLSAIDLAIEIGEWAKENQATIEKELMLADNRFANKKEHQTI
jgi:transcriptional regulator with XRE-family HTH domain